MNTDRIRALRRLLPNPSYRGDPALAGSSFSTQVSGFSEWEDSPEFGYNFVMALLHDKKDLPAMVKEQWLVALYRMERFKFFNTHVAEALSWREHARKKYRDVVEGMLICEDAPFELIAEKTNLPQKSIECYEQLFFNVKDRMDDNVYLSRLAYPNGITCHNDRDYFSVTDPGMLLLRAGFNRGIEDVLFFAGLRGHSGAGVDAAGILEHTIMTEGLVYARNGGLSQRGLPQITAAKAIIVAKKSGGENERIPDPSGMSDIGAAIRSVLITRAQSSVRHVLGAKNETIDVEAEEISLPTD